MAVVLIAALIPPLTLAMPKITLSSEAPSFIMAEMLSPMIIKPTSVPKNPKTVTAPKM